MDTNRLPPVWQSTCVIKKNTDGNYRHMSCQVQIDISSWEIHVVLINMTSLHVHVHVHVHEVVNSIRIPHTCHGCLMFLMVDCVIQIYSIFLRRLCMYWPCMHCPSRCCLLVCVLLWVNCVCLIYGSSSIFHFSLC